MNRGITTVVALAVVGSAALNLALYSIAHAGGPGAIVSVGAIDWNPTTWDWPWIVGTSITVLGALIAALRPISLATKWSGDNWLVEKLETVLAFIVKVLVPIGIRSKSMPLSLGGGKGGVGDQPYPPRAPLDGDGSSGGKSGGGAA